MKKISNFCGFLLALILLPINASAASNKPILAPHPSAKIAIIIDDLGYNRPSGERALQLPGNITYAIIPFTPYGKTLAETAHQQKRQVLMHMPMESSDPLRRLDIGGLTSDLSEAEVRRRIDAALQAVPHIVGFNNHMGSNITGDVRMMHWVMQQAQNKPLFFIDSKTNPLSVAHTSARHYQIPSLSRDIFLDNVKTEAAVGRMFHALIKLAKQRGHAIAIGHPYPATLNYLERNLPLLQQWGVELVNVSELVSEHGTPNPQPLDADKLLQWLMAMPAPQSQRLNFSNEGLY